MIEGGVILSIVEKGWEDLPDAKGDVEEVMFWTIVTDKGTTDVETRLSHNGYYGGSVDWTLPTSDDDAPWWSDWPGEQYATKNYGTNAVRGVIPEGY